jgi:hypothetical protein
VLVAGREDAEESSRSRSTSRKSLLSAAPKMSNPANVSIIIRNRLSDTQKRAHLDCFAGCKLAFARWRVYEASWALRAERLDVERLKLDLRDSQVVWMQQRFSVETRGGHL